ncbi:MAG: histidine kinase [Alphaproteobacteria bacterium]|nr:histidine kinase [Alphaproteobacteria bacterium]
MATLDDDLRTRLPRGVLSDMGGWTLYQSFRTFTWPWLLRRGTVFWPLALAAGSAFAAYHASTMGAWSDWPPLAWRACLAGLATVTLGPALATLVRHLRPPLILERVLVIAAIGLGLWIGLVALSWASHYHDHIMARYSGRSMKVGAFAKAFSQILRASIDTSVFVWIFAGGGLATIYYLGERRRLAQYATQRQLETLRAERNAADMRLAVLQAQVEPHFLFNTLASVRSLIIGEPARAAQTIDALASYLRVALPRLREDRIQDATLDRQIDLCLGYLDLMRVRMAGRLSVRVEVEAGVRALPFPPLILLTLVENAVTHGVEPKPGPGEIAILARVEGDELTVAIEDDGAGLTQGITPGLGLANVRAQLQNLFGDRASLEVTSRPAGGVNASIRVPIA